MRELEGAGHSITKVVKMRLLLCCLPKDYQIAEQTIVVLKHVYTQTVAKLIVRKSRKSQSQSHLRKRKTKVGGLCFSSTREKHGTVLLVERCETTHRVANKIDLLKIC